MKDPNTISLEAARSEPLAFEFQLRFPLEALDREPLVEISPVRFAGEVSPIESGFALHGDLSWGGRLECSRCLASYPFRSDEEFSLVLYRRQTIGEAELVKGSSLPDARRHPTRGTARGARGIRARAPAPPAVPPSD